ncbi:hypothetical protein [Arcobacter sp.]|uniref:hypothetical protein n=1 Tax=Arcobacter sp. TaxID=1872629 RepID=UPI003D127776
MLLNSKSLFEISVYRIDENSYNEDFKKYVDKNTTPYSQPSISSFGGEWEYNEIIGYLKFYISGGTQIRVEYKETDVEKKVKTRTKTFVLNSDSFCASQIYKNMNNQSLIETIKECINDCKAKLPNRYIDTTFIDNTIDYTDWESVIA